MDDLSRAVSQFYPSASGGMSGNSIPPTPSDSSILAAGDTSQPDNAPSANFTKEELCKRNYEIRKYKKKMEECYSIKEEILESETFIEACLRGEREFPLAAKELSREEVLQKALEKAINGNAAREGMLNPVPSQEELRAYKKSLTLITRTLLKMDQKEPLFNYGLCIENSIHKVYQECHDQIK